jgi:hypothetical protein
MVTDLISGLKETYINARSRNYPLRCKGRDYQSIQMPFLGIGVILFFVELYCLSLLGINNREISILLGAFTLYIFAYWPEGIYHDQKRWPRMINSKYPKLKQVIGRLVKPGGEEATYNIPILEINGKEYFLPKYIVKQKWWEMKMKADLKGTLLFDCEGNIIQSSDLYLLSYFVFANACTGSVNIQKIDFGVAQNIKDTMKRFLPLAAWFLRMQKWQFEKACMLDQWNGLMNGVEMQKRGLADAVGKYDDKDKVRKAIGYSFGSRYYLEDARIEAYVYHTFGRYMRAAYRQEINILNKLIKDTEEKISSNSNWFFKWFTCKALASLSFANILITAPVVDADWFGIPRDWEWQSYVDRLKYARELGLQVVEIGEFSEEYPIERIKQLFPDYDWDR